jgi:precorrin-6Y C5,15-methyltransferase (decarboxylating)
MKKVIIFSGTTEGRILSDKLTKECISHIVSVASEYGKEMMEESAFAEIHVGRMDANEIISFLTEREFSEEDMVIDATHPFATEVTSNIKEAAESLGVNLIRVIREEEKALPKDAEKYSDITDCANSLDKTEGNILLTTGSKELGQYCKSVSEETKKRTYVRVLPSIDSIKLCEREGIESDHIIAMHGPFGTELNEAIIRQYDIKHLVTKESGAAGGFLEKVATTVITGAQLHIIERPYTEDGVSVDAAFKIITGKDFSDAAVIPCENKRLSVSLVGIGMGTESSLTTVARDAIEKAEAVFGAERLLRNISNPKKFSMYLSKDIIPVLENENIRNAVITFSGDIGFYSGAKKMIEALRKWRSDIDIQVIPGISSFAYLAAKLGESYDDACLFSIHGKNSDKDIKALTDKVIYNEKVFVLLSGVGDISEIAKELIAQSVEGRICVGINLSYENEKIIELSLEEAVQFKEDGIATIMIKNLKPLKRLLINVKKDSDFIRDKVPMTKECIRHESIIRLGLREGDTFYDIGGGTGSVAIEAASLDLSLQVYTIEKKKEAVELIKENIKKADIPNVEVLEGDAVDLLGDMQKPDAVFIGGSGGRLSEIVSMLHSKGDGIRFVINAVSLETIEEVREVIKKYEPDDEETVMISVSDVKKLGSYHMLQGQNPIWICSFTI